MATKSINGKEIAREIFENLHLRIKNLKKKEITPHLVMILVGSNPASSIYVRQKILRAKEIGAKTTLKKLSSRNSQLELLSTIGQWNNDNNTHGIIVQRPLPPHLDKEAVSLAISPQKDIDGFHPKSKFKMPLATAVLRILQASFARLDLAKLMTFTEWLKSKKIVIIGKGETGGGPVIKRLKELGIKSKVIDSKTHNPKLLTRNANIIISAVGKPNIVGPGMIKKGVILISIGLYRDKDGKLHGDYEEKEIKNKAWFYTPTPGGVGPVNVACLLENLVKAAKIAILAANSPSPKLSKPS